MTETHVIRALHQREHSTPRWMPDVTPPDHRSFSEPSHRQDILGPPAEGQREPLLPPSHFSASQILQPQNLMQPQNQILSATAPTSSAVHGARRKTTTAAATGVPVATVQPSTPRMLQRLQGMAWYTANLLTTAVTRQGVTAQGEGTGRPATSLPGTSAQGDVPAGVQDGACALRVDPLAQSNQAWLNRDQQLVGRQRRDVRLPARFADFHMGDGTNEF